ncbi:hypothetical protein ACGE24_07960 [Corynebacterium kroppenstedtii]|uniref:hypothetical protein n=1 Tax=Corynebacterium sp. PCR 32 TaxID=3351342 RepID=UPI0030A6A974
MATNQLKPDGGPTPTASPSTAVENGYDEAASVTSETRQATNSSLPGASQQKERAFRPAQEPRKSPKARGWMFVLGLVFLTAGGIGIRDVLVVTDTVSGPSWLHPIITWLSHAHWVPMFLAIAIVALILGLIILIASVRPRSKTHMLVDKDASVWMRPVDIARACSARAKDQRGVLNATTVATAKCVTITVTGDPDDPGLSDRVVKACRPVVQTVSSQPDLKVRRARPRSDQ